MYSGSTLKQLRTLDTWLGAHQKLDRLARRQLTVLSKGNDMSFPTIKQILCFEGMDGPDGIKRKTPAKDEPWHYYDPYDPTDTQILDIIDNHFNNLVAALRAQNTTKASFEAAWLGHAVVDGLTPAHHYPYEEELTRLRGGEGIETRTTPKEKLLMHGDTVREKMRNNWQMWGDKGLLATHISFEIGVAVLILPLRWRSITIDEQLQREVIDDGHLPVFKRMAREIADLKLYDTFYNSGWTPRLASRVKKELAPRIVVTLSLLWFAANQTAATPVKGANRGKR